MKKLVTETILPISKRKNASQKELLSAYEKLEKVVKAVLNDHSARYYDVYSKKMDGITDQVGKLEFDITKPDEPAYQIFIHNLEKSKPIFEGLKYLRENSTLSRLLSDNEISILDEFVENQ